MGREIDRQGVTDMTATSLRARALAVAVVLGAAAVGSAYAEPARLYVTRDKSKHLVTAERITKVSVASPRIADVVVISPQELLINGKETGATTLVIFQGARMQEFDLVVYPAPVNEAAVADPASEPYTVLVQRADKVTDHVFVKSRESVWLELGTVRPATEATRK
jgi:Flp pilus assembly secretin CpaC